jgi:hypothetical protein
MTQAPAIRAWPVVLLVALAIAGWAFAIEHIDPSRELLWMHDHTVLEFIDSEGFGQRQTGTDRHRKAQPA